ncbi:unnamed protein product, partial [Gulo gulo]
MLQEPQLRQQRGTPCFAVDLAAVVHRGVLPVHRLPPPGTHPPLVSPKTPLHTQLHPHELVCFFHPESPSCA